MKANTLKAHEWLRELCDQAGFSQAEMAKHMGITQSVYSKLVTDKTPFRPAYFFAACEATKREPLEEKKRIRDEKQFSPFLLKEALSNCSPTGETLRKLNLKRSLISNCKRGSIPSEDKLASIAQALQVHPDSLRDSFLGMLKKYRRNWRDHLHLSEAKTANRKTALSTRQRNSKAVQSETELSRNPLKSSRPSTRNQTARRKPTLPSSQSDFVVIAIRRETYEEFAKLLARCEGREIPILEI